MTENRKLSSNPWKPNISAHSLDRLLAFLPLFQSPATQLYKLHAPHNASDNDDGTPIVPIDPYEYTEDFNRFLGTLQFSGLLQPTKTKPLAKVPVELLVEHPELLTMANLEVLSRLLTAHAHNSRYTSGYWATLIESGHLRAILERVKVIRDEMSEEAQKIT